MDEFRNAITPVLTVRCAAEAAIFYEAALTRKLADNPLEQIFPRP